MINAIAIGPVPYAHQSVVAAFDSHVVLTRNTSLTRERLHALMQAQANGTLADADVPAYTNEQHTNRALLAAGVWRIVPLFSAPRYGPIYRLFVEVPVPLAVTKLRADSGIAYVSPEWNVSPMR